MVQESDLEALDYFKILSGSLATDQFHPYLGELAERLYSFDFDGAKESLQTLANQIDHTIEMRIK